MTKGDIVGFVIIALILLGVGWLSNDIYRNYSTQKDYEGLYIMNREYQRTMDLAREYDSFGDWVCINVRGMDYDDVVRVCQHEAAHEVFAEVIQEHPEKIIEVMEVIGK